MRAAEAGGLWREEKLLFMYKDVLQKHERSVYHTDRT